MKNRTFRNLVAVVTVMVVTLLTGCEHPLEEVTPEELEPDNKKELCMGCVKIERKNGGDKVVKK